MSKCKCKFKVGDYVIGKTYNYPMTGKGWIGKVTKVYDNGKFEARGKNDIVGLAFQFVNLDPKDFDLYTKDQPTKIVITTDGKTTTAKMYRDKSVVKVETTNCHPDDRFDFMVGAKIAFNRLVGTPTGTCVEEPKYYNGKVVCVDKGDNPTMYTTGKIYQFVDGQLVDDEDKKFPNSRRIMSFKDWQDWSTAQWLEVVE